MSEICRVTLRVDSPRGPTPETCQANSGRIVLSRQALDRRHCTAPPIAVHLRRCYDDSRQLKRPVLGTPALRGCFLGLVEVQNGCPGRKAGARTSTAASPTLTEHIIGWPAQGQRVSYCSNVQPQAAPTVPRFKQQSTTFRPSSTVTSGRTAQEVSPSPSCVSDDLHGPGLAKSLRMRSRTDVAAETETRLNMMPSRGRPNTELVADPADRSDPGARAMLALSGRSLPSSARMVLG